MTQPLGVIAMHESINHAKLAMLFRREFQLCNVRNGETIVLLSDLGARRDYVSAAFAAAEDLGADAYEMCVNAMPSWTKVGVETVGRCKGTLDAIKAADMLVCLHIPLFTRWLKEARDAGTRVLMVIDGPDELEELMAPPGLKEAVVHADERLKRARTMRITRPGGTASTAIPKPLAASTIGARATSTPSRTKARPTAPSCSIPATSSCCPIAATCRTTSGSRSATASSARSKAGSTPS
jgi:hypothetical protein